MQGRLGSGGMGEVYLARDSKLRREVAVKVLPEEFAHDGERLERFRREARLLAALNHTNIGAIYGLEESDGMTYLVLELVPGQTLAERIGAGPLGVEEALQIGGSIAEALELFRRQNWRRSAFAKPKSSTLTLPSGVTLILAGLRSRWTIPFSCAARSPIVAETGTVEGVILGTAAYMSPEQARGKPIDKRTDIWQGEDFVRANVSA